MRAGYVGCGIAGASDELVAILLAEMQEQGGDEAASVLGHAGRLPVASAAMVNGAASHALDFDDVNLAMPGHPSVAILPALLALAEERGSSGADVLTAFVAGYELQCRIGRTIAPGHYDGLGFHATATVGSFGAAAACAHLLGLDADRFATALGIAGTQAAGLKSMFGTMCKPLHAGKAAYHGLMAAKLAARGFTSRTDVVECGQGFARTHSPDFNPERAFDTPPSGWWIASNLFKYHASCYMTHAAIEAARKLREQHGFAPDQVERIAVRLEESCDRICNIPAPVTGLEAKFSLRLTTAMGLGGRGYKPAVHLLRGGRGRPGADRAARQGVAGFPHRDCQHVHRNRVVAAGRLAVHRAARCGHSGGRRGAIRASGWRRSLPRWSIRCWAPTRPRG